MKAMEQMEQDGYKILNAKIVDADLTMADHGCFTLTIGIDGDGWGCSYGGYCLGHGYLNAKKFDGSAKGLEYIMRIMDVVGVERFSELNGKYVRVATKGYGDIVKIIGNIVKDKWFDPDEFFRESDGGADG